MSKVCCVHCFTNDFIQATIRKARKKGECDYCNMKGNKQVWVADVGDVGDFIRERLALGYTNATRDDVPFHALRSISTTIEDVLIFEEEIFSEELDNKGKIGEILGDLFKESGPSYRDIAQGADDEWEGGDAPIVLKDAFFVSGDDNPLTLSWSDFTYYVKHICRYFDMGAAPYRESALARFLPIIRGMATTLPQGTDIWRARIMKPGDGRVLKATRHLECGPPPRNKAIPLRMNPSGISYFYGAEDIATCLEEVRVKRRDRVLQGKFRTKLDLTIVDLSHKVVLGVRSVFDPNYDHDYNWASHFVENFIEEVSRPISTKEAPIEYVPTQILCEYIRKLGYDGVRYKSSLTGKMNYALFCGRAETNVTDAWWRHPDQVPDFTGWLELVEFKQERH
ncbi:RES family NAD+ phosphorylase [Paenibacillus validus]|uniref:RES family NAD+ phosphorylase n=1 Tax=Paenibacillus chartarius TaxID=747481 RepID=A0ABV6DMK5_9BACL|nr:MULTISPECIES: RES family NAD+ phosphorylase [Paenibacillaceae]MED4600017.1 RES family NAD+ phosphorylase [Paenibacillus validus]MED4605716.1 RES family NAD+ phosphorylase [Paenibacillus validus]